MFPLCLKKLQEEKQDFTKFKLKELNADREKFKRQLSSLRLLLEKTTKRVGDIIRNSRRRHSQITQDPYYIENIRLQHDVEKRIEDVKKKIEDINKTISENKSSFGTTDSCNNLIFLETSNLNEEDEESNSQINYTDPGNHWCSKCDELFSKAKSFFEIND